MKPKEINQEELTNTKIDVVDKPILAPSNKIQWVECDDVYKPIEKPLILMLKSY